MPTRSWGEHLNRLQTPVCLGAIVLGAVLGLLAPPVAPVAARLITPVLAILLFVTFLQVPVSMSRETLTDGRFLGAVLVLNFVALPLVVELLTVAVPADPVRVAMLLVLLCPCVDYVIVFSGLAGAHADRLLATTPVLLIVQILLLPLYLLLFAGRSAVGVIDPRPFAIALGAIIVAPFLVAWATQSLARRFTPVRTARRSLDAAMVPLLAIVLMLVVASQIGRVRDHVGWLPSAVGIYIAFLMVMPVVGIGVARLFRLDVGDTRAVIFSGGTRNSLVVLPLALSLPAAESVAAAVVVTQTMVELFGMVVYVRLIPRLVPHSRGLRRASPE